VKDRGDAGQFVDTMHLRICTALASALLVVTPSLASAFPVDVLPEDNLLANPWFRSADDPDSPGFDGWNRWTDGGDPLIGGSQKQSNPSPDTVVAPDCGGVAEYCGTALRWAEERPDCDMLRAGMDAYADQIVAASDPQDRLLRFHTWWVSHRIEVAEVDVFGSASENGPWTPLWKPFAQSFDHDAAAGVGGSGEDRSQEWIALTATTPLVEHVLPQAFAYYRLQIHARYGAAPDCSVGVKMTGIYFTTAPVEDEQGESDGGGSSESGTEVESSTTGDAPDPDPPESEASGDGEGAATEPQGCGCMHDDTEAPLPLLIVVGFACVARRGREGSRRRRPIA
jgi:hypothetical protein